MTFELINIFLGEYKIICEYVTMKLFSVFTF